MTCGVIQIDFCDVGLPAKGGWSLHAGFEGSAEVDTDGAVVALTMRVSKGAETRWETFPVSFRHGVYTGLEATVRNIADEIATTYADTIKEKLTEFSVSLAEKEFVHEAAE